MTSRKNPRRTSPLAAAALAMASLGAVGAQAQTVQTESQLRVTRDAETGQLRPATAAEARAMDRAGASGRAIVRRGLITGRVSPQQVVHADGTVEQELDESTLMYSVARRAPDGSVDRVCVTGDEQANKTLQTPVFTSRKTTPRKTALGAVYEDK